MNIGNKEICVDKEILPPTTRETFLSRVSLIIE